jgi:type VI secretion system protein VasD
MNCESRLVTLRSAGLFVWMICVAGCASVSGGEPGLLDKTLQWAGITVPTAPDISAKDLPQINKKVTLRLHAGEVLNTDPSGRPLAVVTRIYKLKDSAAFAQATYESFRDAAAGKVASIEQDLVETREIVLKPGQHYEVVETLTPNVNYLAVVALFRAPAQARWRFVFETKPAVASGITLGLHACALSVAQGQPVAAAPESLRVAGVRCQ